MANELGQPTAQEIAEKFCTEMLCNALLCDGCPVQAILHAAQPLRAGGQLPLCPECGETLLEDDRRWECVNESCGNCR